MNLFLCGTPKVNPQSWQLRLARPSPNITTCYTDRQRRALTVARRQRGVSETRLNLGCNKNCYRFTAHLNGNDIYSSSRCQFFSCIEKTTPCKSPTRFGKRWRMSVVLLGCARCLHQKSCFSRRLQAKTVSLKTVLDAIKGAWIVMPERHQKATSSQRYSLKNCCVKASKSYFGYCPLPIICTCMKSVKCFESYRALVRTGRKTSHAPPKNGR